MSQVKEYLSEERHKLRLFDLVAKEIQKVIARAGEDQFPSDASWNEQEFRERVDRYNTLLRDWTTIQALLGYWATPATYNSLILGPKRLSDRLGTSTSGNTFWLSLRWYPCLLLLYAGGIAAVAGKQYPNLRELLHAATAARINCRGKPEPYITAAVDGALDSIDAFKLLPGHDRHYVARSEYLFDSLQPHVDHVLFLGSEYEATFDRFEVLLALEYAHLNSRTNERVWGPVGRFGWKYSRGSSSNPYAELVSDATVSGPTWPPAIAGLFSGSTDRFLELAKTYGEQLARRGW